jgi:oligopeptidase B
VTAPDGARLEPPVAPQRPVTLELHGDVRVDEYAWLHEREDPEVIAYLEAENRYAEAATAHLAPLRETLYREMLGRIQETDVSVPERVDGWLYYVRTEEGRQYPVLCRRRDAEGAPEQVVLDENALAEGQAYFRVGASEVSSDHRYLAYSVDTSGAEEFVIQVKDLATGELLADGIPGTSGDLEWAEDNRTLFYTVLNDIHRPAILKRHRLGTDPSEDVTVFHEPDEGFFMGLSKSRSRRFVFLELASHSTSEVWWVPADAPEAPLRLFRARERGVEYDLDHHGDHFYILTNEHALNFMVLRTPVPAPGADSDAPIAPREEWEVVVPHHEDVKIDGIDLFRDHLVVYERSEALQRIRVIHLPDMAEHYVAFDEPTYGLRLSGNPEFDTGTLRFVLSSPVTPPTTIDYDMATRASEVRKVQPVLGGFDPSRYKTERRWATAPDGASVPISLVYRAPLEHDGRRPMLLNGYGAYGLSYDPNFSTTAISLLDRGLVVGIAHVRGGEEMGRHWYMDGKLLKKRNSFEDFIAAAEYLVKQGVTASDRLVISGGSAGGMLMGAVTNARPDLFRAVLADVPFVDVLNTMLDPTLPLTVIEYDEWGDPRDPEYYRYMRTYSPYDNVERKAYPRMLIQGGLNDPRVTYWEPAKWAARLRARKTDDHLLLLKTNMGAGHGGASGRYDYLREVAFQWGFILDSAGVG